MPIACNLEGKTFIVTGASSGLGAHFAGLLSTAGARVALVARRRERLQDLAARIRAGGGPPPILAEADVRSVASIRDAVTSIVDQAGVPDGLVNNAGTVDQARALDVSEQSWDGVLDTNLKGAWFFATCVAQAMVAGGAAGTIVDIASITGLRPAGGVGPYAISKAALVHMTRQLAVEWARHDIRVNALAPGYIETDLNRDFFKSDAGQALIKRVPQRRLGTLADLDAPLLMLCDDASAYLTGTIIPVDGGHSVNPTEENETMDFSLSPQVDALRLKVRQFIAETVLPLEADAANFDAHENIAEQALAQVRSRAKAAGLWAPQMPVARGGLGLGVQAMAAIYEEANRSIFGPVALNCAAPDDGNMIVLEKVATEAQKTRWLQPIVDGTVRSAFVMTEPHPGGGSDPSMIRTTAERHGDRWIVNGHKWFITGAGAAQHFILIAKTSADPRRGLTAFLFDRDQPGWEIVRRIPIMGPEEHGGHCELRFDGLEIPDENRLMEVGDGLKLTQIRLGTARLTHCMRWLGLAKRALEIARIYVAEREGFGMKLADRESVQLQLGEAAMGIEVGRLLTMRAAWALDQGSKARKEVSMAKIQVADTLHRAVDTAIQLNGARGYSKDTVLEWIYRYARQARLVDGASEVHKMVLNRFLNAEGDDFWRWSA